MKRLILIAFALAVAAWPSAAAAGTLDQSQTAPLGGSGPVGKDGVGEVRIAAQTFTAGLTGRIDRVDLYIRHSLPFMGEPCSAFHGVDVGIRTTVGDLPSGTTFGGGNIGGSSLTTEFAWASAEISPPAPVTAGTRYALVVSSEDSCPEPGFPYDWAGAFGNPYAGGAAYQLVSSNWMVQGEFDEEFKTYVDTSVETPQTPPLPTSRQTPPSSPGLTRTLTISYSQKRHAFHGKLTSDSSACVSGQKVKVFRKKKGKDPSVGTTATYANGSYSLRAREAKGRFYAKVGTATVTGGTCLPAQSKTIGLG